MNSAYLAHIGDLTPFLSYIGWWFVPGYVSKLVLTIFYRICPSRRPIQPVSHITPSTGATGATQTTADNTPKKPIYNPIYELQNAEFQRKSRHHRSIAHGIVICLYLGYTLIHAYRDQAGKNHYAILGIESNSLESDPTSSSSSSNNSPTAGNLNDDSASNLVKLWVVKGDLLDQAGLKSHWRKLAKSFHPDKLTPPPHIHSEYDLNIWKSNIESKFINMREAYETLSDTTKQWAYDRFGPSVSQCKKCITSREFLMEGLKQSAPFYGFSAASLLFVGSLKKADTGTFWRWTMLMFVVGVELMILTSKTMTISSIVISQIFPNRAQFEQIELLRKFFIASSCVVTQLCGILHPTEDPAKKKQTINQMAEPLLGLVEQLEEHSELANVELIKLIFNDLHPILKNNESEDGLDPIPSSELDTTETSQKALAEDLRVKKVITQLKEKMLDTFCDLKLQSDAVGQATWINALNSSSTSAASATS